MPTEPTGEELKRYVRFDEDDARRLAALRPHAAPHFERIVADFYARTREHEAAHAVFTGEEQIARLQRSLVAWLDRLLGGVYDDAYFARSAEVGRVHVRVGLPQRYTLVAMSVVRQALEAIADAALGAEAGATRAALHRLLDAELAVMLDAYCASFGDRIARAQSLEREILHRDLARVESRLHDAVDLAGLVVVGLDRLGRVRVFNGAAQRVTAIGREEVAGADFVEALLEEDLGAEPRRALAAALLAPPGTRSTLDAALRTKAGHYRDVTWHLTTHDPKTDEDLAVYALGRDVTEERKQGARRSVAARLDAVGNLATGFAHELRNPLNAAALQITLLEREARARGLPLAAVQSADAEIRRLADLVTEFLEFARPPPLALGHASVKEICARAVAAASARARGGPASVTFDVVPSDVTIDCDAARVEVMLVNLLDNAVEASAPSGGAPVVLRARRRPRSVTFEVEDAGPGLASPDAPIFDPFFSTKAQGTGLGLAVAHRIAADHGGEIAVTSRPGRTVFAVTLPLEARSGVWGAGAVVGRTPG